MPELLEHVAQRRLRPSDAQNLLLRERIDRLQVAEVGQLFEGRTQPGLDDAVDLLGGRRFQTQRLDRAVLRKVNGVVQTILDVAVQGWHKPVPEAALGK